MPTTRMQKRKKKLALKQVASVSKDKPAPPKIPSRKVENQSMDKYLKALKKYLSLKKKYDKKLAILKQKIKGGDGSWIEKQRNFERRKRCVMCEGVGGTKFDYSNRTYTAVCASDTPCELNIEFKRPSVKFIPKELEQMDHILEYIKQNIVKNKLSLVFGLEDEDAITAEFTQFRDNYREGSKYIRKLTTYLEDSLNTTEREANIHQAQEKLYSHLNQIKQLLIEYEQEEDQLKIQAIIERYIQEIEPLQIMIRTHQYATIEVVKFPPNSNPMYRLIQKKENIQNQEYIEDKPKIIRFITKKKGRK